MKSAASSVTTKTLLNQLFRTATFDRFKTRYGDEMKPPSLAAHLTRLCEARGEARERVIKRAELDRVYGHQIFSGMRQPTRDKVIQLAFGFGMNVEETQDLLKIARKSALYPRIERDAAILFCLHRGTSLLDTQMMLSDLNLALIGMESARE